MHLCMASSIRAMPEKEKPPAMRVDLYFYVKKPLKSGQIGGIISNIVKLCTYCPKFADAYAK